jgi:hypothetical protein
VDREESTVSERRLTPQRWSVTVQHRWEDTEPVVALAVGGWEAVGPGLVECVLAETVDPVEAVEAAVATAERLSLAIDLESHCVYGDWPDATARGTGYSPEELGVRAGLWASLQPQCDGCGECAELTEWEDDEGWSVAVCSERCGERAVWLYLGELEREESRL